MSEEWRPVVGWEAVYEVSDQGRVRTIAATIQAVSQAGNPYLRRRKARIRKTRPDKDGYPVVILAEGKRRGTGKIHRMVLEAFVGPSPEGMMARHLNGNPGDCRLVNLRWGTPQENWADRRKHGFTWRGEYVNTAKLSVDDVREIRQLASEGTTQVALSERFGVTRTNIRSIITRETWRHVS